MLLFNETLCLSPIWGYMFPYMTTYCPLQYPKYKDIFLRVWRSLWGFRTHLLKLKSCFPSGKQKTSL